MRRLMTWPIVLILNKPRWPRRFESVASPPDICLMKVRLFHRRNGTQEALEPGGLFNRDDDPAVGPRGFPQLRARTNSLTGYLSVVTLFDLTDQ